MNNIVLMSDSTCDLSDELIQKYQIKIIPLYVSFSDGTYKDRVELTTEGLYQKVSELGSLPKTSAPSMGDFYEFFKPLIDAGKDIVYIGLSSKLSATLQSARLAAQEFPEGRIQIVDSLNLSTGIGLLVLKAAKFRDEGLSAEQIASQVTQIVPKIKTAFVINTFDYLHKGGRCSALTSIVGTMLKIKPIIHVVDGGMIVGQKPRGIKKAYQLMLDQINSDANQLDNDFVMVTHSLAKDAADYLKDQLNEQLEIKEILQTEAGCVISSHCGRETIGILYIVK
jgi:DegV family protein with EDD domain